jgi:positive phototaxis protein PixI
MTELATLDIFGGELALDFFSEGPIGSPTQQNRFLQFGLKEYLFLFPLQKLQEIFNLNLNQVTLVPGLDSYVMGICNWRGNLAWLIDLQELLTGKQTNFKENCLCLLTPLKGQYLGMVVDRVEGISSFIADDLLSISATMIEPIGTDLIEGYFLDGQNQPLLLLDAQAIINRFTHL